MLDGILYLVSFCLNQGVLADILEPIMGKGLIPADLDTWKPRRRGEHLPSFQAWHLPLVNIIMFPRITFDGLCFRCIAIHGTRSLLYHLSVSDV